MPDKKVFLLICILMLVATGSVYSAPGVEVSGELKLSGTGTISFPDGSVQTTAGDCHGRYEDNGDGTVTDCRTALIWLKDASCSANIGGIDKIGTLTWANATTWVAALGNGSCELSDGSYAGDWRLPTKTEWMAMVQSARKSGYTIPVLTNAAGRGQWTAGDIFDNIQSYYYWSGSSSGTSLVWVVGMDFGSVSYGSKFSSFYVWPVRSGQ